MRYMLALAVLAVSWSAAVLIHERNQPGAVTPQATDNPFLTGGVNYGPDTKPSWEDPVAVLIAVGGAAAAVVIVVTGRSRRTGTDLIRPYSRQEAGSSRY